MHTKFWHTMCFLFTFMLTPMLTVFTGGCTEERDPILQPEVNSEQIVDGEQELGNEHNDQSEQSDLNEAQHLVIPPWIDKQEVMDIAINDFGLTDDELIEFEQIIDDGYVLGRQVPQEMLEGDDIAPSLTKSTCSNQRHSYNWYSLTYAYGGDADYKFYYTRSMSGWGWQGGGWYYIPINPNAVAVAAWYGFMLSSGGYTMSGYSYSWMVLGDRAVNIGFGRNASLAGNSYWVYRQLCR